MDRCVQFYFEHSSNDNVSIDNLLNSDEPFLFATILSKDLGVKFDIIDNAESAPDVKYSIEEMRINIEQRAHEINQLADTPEVPELNVSPEVSEIEFSGFINGRPQATWTIRNLLHDLNEKLVFPSWQRKSDA